MTSGLVNASFSLPEWQAVKMIFFAPCVLTTELRRTRGELDHIQGSCMTCVLIGCRNSHFSVKFSVSPGRSRVRNFKANKIKRNIKYINLRIFLVVSQIFQAFSESHQWSVDIACFLQSISFTVCFGIALWTSQINERKSVSEVNKSKFSPLLRFL